jgi:hypothetical protein
MFLLGKVKDSDVDHEVTPRFRGSVQRRPLQPMVGSSFTSLCDASCFILPIPPFQFLRIMLCMTGVVNRCTEYIEKAPVQMQSGFLFKFPVKLFRISIFQIADLPNPD